MFHEVYGISRLAEELCIHMDGYLVQLMRHIGAVYPYGWLLSAVNEAHWSCVSIWMVT
jgi:hypothetical protein